MTADKRPTIPLTYAYVDCRLGHEWELREDYPKRSDAGGQVWMDDCLECGSIRIAYYDVRGYRVKEKSRIVHPNGYKLEKGLVVPDFRVFKFNQIMSQRKKKN
jgi:hypothetical protein